MDSLPLNSGFAVEFQRFLLETSGDKFEAFSRASSFWESLSQEEQQVRDIAARKAWTMACDALFQQDVGKASSRFLNLFFFLFVFLFFFF